MLCLLPTKVTNTLDQVPGFGDGNDQRDMGVTTEPTGASPPRLKLDVYKEGLKTWKAKCTLTPAVEGTNTAAYLGPGTYRTGIAWWPDSGGFGTADANHTEIHAILDATNSDWSRRAELEHCNDWIRAHELTLKAAENTIRYASNGLQNRRFDGPAAAYQGALDAFVAHSSHARIANVFRASIIVTISRHDFFPQTFKDGLTALFLDVGRLTGVRDSNGWHTFGYSGAVANNELAVMDRLKANGRDYRRVMRPPAFSVGNTTSEQLIVL